MEPNFSLRLGVNLRESNFSLSLSLLNQAEGQENK